MKRVLIILSLLATPAAVHAEDAASAATPSVEVEGSVVSSYIFPKQAVVVSKNPAVNAALTWNQSQDFSGYVWGQVGDYDAVEVDLGETAAHTFGNGVSVHGEAAVYLYPNGSSRPVGTIAAGVSAPLGHGFTASTDLQVYRGGFDTEVYSVDLSHAIGPVTVTVGQAWNPREHLNPTYFMMSVPLGHSDRPVTIGFKGFVGAGNGFGVSISHRFR